MSAQLKGGARLVEADVTIVADAQQLQVDAAHALDHIIIAGALSCGVQIGAVRQIDALRADVHQIKQVAVHKAPVALRMLSGQAAVLVQVDGGDFREVNVILVVPFHQLLVDAHGGAAGGQTQHAVGFHDDLRRDDVGGLAGHVIVVLRANDFHNGKTSCQGAAKDFFTVLCVLPIL